MQLRGRKSVWMIWLVSYAVWILIAFMTGFSMYRFNILFWKPTGFWEELRLPLINDLIFATFTPILLQLSLRYPIERSNWRWRSPAVLSAERFVFTIAHAVVRMLVYPVIDQMTHASFSDRMVAIYAAVPVQPARRLHFRLSAGGRHRTRLVVLPRISRSRSADVTTGNPVGPGATQGLEEPVATALPV